MADGADLIQKWQDQNGAHSFEGDSGLERLEDLVDVLGYSGHGFRFGDPIQQFLSDNPGAVEAILAWIEEQVDQTPEWRESLEAEVGADDEDGEDEP